MGRRSVIVKDGAKPLVEEVQKTVQKFFPDHVSISTAAGIAACAFMDSVGIPVDENNVYKLMYGTVRDRMTEVK